MILLDTHVWVHWVNNSSKSQASHLDLISATPASAILVQAISIWEVSKLFDRDRIQLGEPLGPWYRRTLHPNLVRIVPLDGAIGLECSRLPQPLHRDPMDQILIATSRVLGCPLLTEDGRILEYPHVETIG